MPSFGAPHAREVSTNYRESREEQLKWLGARAHDVPGEAEGAGLVQPEVEKVCGTSNCSSPLQIGRKGSYREDRATFCRCAQ